MAFHPNCGRRWIIREQYPVGSKMDRKWDDWTTGYHCKQFLKLGFGWRHKKGRYVFGRKGNLR